MQNTSATASGLFKKSCFACGLHKEPLGGSLYGKLKLWRCATCTQKAKEKSNDGQGAT